MANDQSINENAHDPAPSGNAESVPDPRPDQEAIIESDEYPMRVLAGAGTGKTFTMVRKIEQLLEGGTAPDRILALTFTNKAADSMREKLVDRVGPRGHDIEAYTYHAVCHELLQDFAYHADLDPRYSIATDADRLAVVYDVLDDVPYRFTNPDIYEGVAFADGATDRLLKFVQVMKRAGIMPADLREYLVDPARLIELEGLVERIETAVEEHLRVGWRTMTDERIEELQNRLEAFQDELQAEHDALADGGIEADIAGYLDVMDGACDALVEFFERRSAEIVDGDLTAALKLPAHLFGSYSGAPSGMPSIAYEFPKKLRTFVESCQTVSDLVEGYEAYEKRLHKEELLDFNDLVLRTVELLEDDSVNDWITGQYDYVFCDEYQDTDAVQFELVQRMVRDDQLFVVGDDDQAIYEWRGADVDNIGPRLDAAFPSLTDQTLEENFRSRQPILDLANNALGELDERGSDKELTAVEDKADATEGVVTIEGAEDSDNQAEQIVNAITRLLNGDGSQIDEEYSPGDIAILVRKNRHARPIIDGLTERGIPYELGGDLAAESVGVETVVAGLKVLADPNNGVSLNRLLRMRYRLHESDLRRLNTARLSGDGSTLQERLLDLPLETFEEPERIEQAREDLQELWSLRSTYSLSQLYRELKSTLNLEWFLSEQERRDLKAIDEIIDSFDESTIEPELSTDFIEFLARHGSITEGSSRSMEQQPETDATAVSIMTIHKSKGLEFPVAVLPRLEADQWEPSTRTYDDIEHALTEGDPATVDFARPDEREARRLLHVGITRAEDWSILVGRHEEADETDEDNGISAETVDDILGTAVPWSAAGVSFPIWETIQSSLPSTAIDGTDTLATPIETTERVAAVEDDRSLSRSEAQERIFELARAMLAGDLDSTGREDSLIDPSVLSEPRGQRLQRRHSYTSLDTLTTCTRQHYLDHVVRAYSDPSAAISSKASAERGSNSGTETPSIRVVGLLFHAVAERAAKRGYETPERWKQAAESIAAARGQRGALDRVIDCIDRYFTMVVSEWSVRGAEIDFDLTIDDNTVVGQIDALYHTTDGEKVVIDYKATDRNRSIDSDLQLPIYLLAARELFEESIDTAGYAYVGRYGPEIETRTFTPEELQAAREQLRERLQAAEHSSYREYQPGDHCQYCAHQSLACSDAIELD